MLKSVHKVTVEFGDSDPARITYYPNYFHWFDGSAWRLLWKAGLTVDVLEDSFGLFGVPIVEANASFRSPSRFGDELEITSHIDRWSKKTFRMIHEVRRGEVLCAEGYEVRICGARNADGSLKAMPIPDEFRRRLSGDV